jgi:LemA protein
VHLNKNDSKLIGFCAPSWDETIDANGTSNLNNAFRVTFEEEGNYSIQISTSNYFRETVFAYLSEMSAKVNNSWQNIQARYQQRIEQIPGLTVAMGTHDEFSADLINNITSARTLWINSMGIVSNQVDATMKLDQYLRLFVAICENYPELQSDVVIQEFNAEMASTQNMIDAARVFYNDAVRAYNIAIGYPYDSMAQQSGLFPAVYYSIIY